MKMISYIKNEISELKKMPYFLGRLVCFSILFALDELTVTHYTSPHLYWFIIALAVFFIPSVVMQALALDLVGAKLKLSLPLALWLVLGGIATVNEIVFGLMHNGAPIYQAAVFWFFIPVLAYCGKEKGFYKLFLLSCTGPILFNIISGILLFPIIDNVYSLALTGFMPLLFLGFVWSIKRKLYPITLTLFLLLSASFILLFSSNGRTGFFTSIILIPILAFIIIFTKRADKKHISYSERKLSVATVVLILVLALLIVSTLYYIETYMPVSNPERPQNSTILEKIKYSLESNNILTGRGEIWRYALDNISAIGNGPFFFIVHEGNYLHAHNIFIAVLSHYGIVPLVLYCIFCIYAYSTSIKYAIRGKHLRYLPFAVITTYLLCGIVEDIACHVVPRMFAVLFYLSCAILINEYPKLKQNKKAP